MCISDTLESGELSLDNIIAELPEGAENKAVVTGLKFINKNYARRKPTRLS